MDSSEYWFESETERIERQIATTKLSLAEKVEDLQSQVTSTLQSAESTASDSLQNTVEGVKNIFSPSHQMQKNPLPFVIGSIALGLCVGKMFSHTLDRSKEIKLGAKGLVADKIKSPPIPNSETSVFHEISRSIGDELINLKSLAVGVLIGSAREMAQASAPSHFAKNIGKIFDAATEELGGQVIER